MDFIAERVERARRLPAEQRGPHAQGFIQGFELQQRVTAQLAAADSSALNYKGQLQAVLCLLRAHWLSPEWRLLGPGVGLGPRCCAQEGARDFAVAKEQLHEILSQCTCTSATCPTSPFPQGSLLALSITAARLLNHIHISGTRPLDASPTQSSSRGPAMLREAALCADRLAAGKAAPVRQQWQAELAVAGPCGGWMLQELRAALHCLVGVALQEADVPLLAGPGDDMQQRGQQHLSVAERVLPIEHFPYDLVAWVINRDMHSRDQPVGGGGQLARDPGGGVAMQLLGAVRRSNNRCLTAYTAAWTAYNMCRGRQGWRWGEAAEVLRQADEALASIKPWCPPFVFQRMATVRPEVERMMRHARQLFPGDYTTRLLPPCGEALQRGADSAVLMRASQKCSHCGQSSLEVKFCSACKGTVYCSRECQTQHWPQHRQACRAAVAAKKSKGAA